MVGIPYEYHAGVALDTDRAVICGGQTYNDSWCGLSVLVYHPICGHALRQWHKLELFHTMVMVLGGEYVFCRIDFTIAIIVRQHLHIRW